MRSPDFNPIIKITETVDRRRRKQRGEEGMGKEGNAAQKNAGQRKCSQVTPPTRVSYLESTELLQLKNQRRTTQENEYGSGLVAQENDLCTQEVKAE